MSIIEFIKTNLRWILFFLAIFLVMIASFGIGYKIAENENPAPIIIEKCSE